MVFDYLYFGEWHIVLLNFLKFNLLEGKSNFFGVSPFIAYLDSFLPDQLGIVLPFVLLGIMIFAWNNYNNRYFVIFLTVVINFLIYSAIGHKETRYLCL